MILAADREPSQSSDAIIPLVRLSGEPFDDVYFFSVPGPVADCASPKRYMKMIIIFLSSTTFFVKSPNEWDIMPAKESVPYRWARPGDVNAFFGLVLDNLAGLLYLFSLLMAFGFPGSMILTSLVPGTALGVLIGDLAFFFLAIHLAKKTGNGNVTAMPLGLDTPSTFGMILFVLGPSFLAGREAGLTEADAAIRTWHIGIWCLVLSGLFKMACSPFCGFIRRLVPRAALLGSLTAIALVIISFMPTLDILAHPLVGLLALTIVLTSLIGRIPLPSKIPGTLGALLVAGTVYYLSCAVGLPATTFLKFPR